VQVMF